MATLAPVASAHAGPGPATLGSSLGNLAGAPAAARCGGDPYPVPCAGVQEALAGRLTRAPYSGVIVRWRVRGEGSFAIFPVTYTGDDTAVWHPGSPYGTAASAATATVFPARLPIRAGQAVGIVLTEGSGLAWGASANADWDVWRPAPPFGAPTVAGTLRDGGFEAGFSVDIEPDADGDGFGEPTQDACGANPAVQGACPPPPPPPARCATPDELRRCVRHSVSEGLKQAVREARRLARTRRLTFHVRAPAAGTFRLIGRSRRDGPVLLRGRRSFAAPARGVLKARVTPAGRRALRRSRPRRLQLTLTFTDRAGERTHARRTVRLPSRLRVR